MRLPLSTWIILIIIAVTGWVLTSLIAGETPHGRLQGTLIAADTGAPLSKVYVSAAQEGNAKTTYRTITDRQGNFLFPHLPVGTYRLNAQTNAHQQPRNAIGITEGRTTTEIIELQPTEPFLHVFQTQRVFTTVEEPKLRVHGFAPTAQLSIHAYRVAPETVLNARDGLSSALTLNGGNLNYINLGTVPQLSLAYTATMDIKEKDRDGEGIFREEVSTGKLPPGTYLMAVQADDLRELVPLTVTDLGLIVKSAPASLLVYAVNIATGKASTADVQVLNNKQVVASGRTDAGGLLSLPLPKTQGENQFTVVGRDGASTATAQFYRYVSEGDESLRVYTYTDRPVYRPGHKVSFKSILRQLNGDNYTVPANLSTSVRVTDERDNPVYNGTPSTTKFGSLSGDFTLPEDALPGIYTININAKGGQYSANFTVAEYRKPEYEVDVATPQKRYHSGQPIPATITARYFYGAPVPNAQVSYYVTRSQYWYFGEGDAWDEDINAPEYDEGEYLLDGAGRTNDAGELHITIPPQKKAKGEIEGEVQDWRYTIHATVTDASGRSVDGDAGMLVTQGAFRLEVQAEDYVAHPQQPVKMDIRAVDYDGHPVPGARGSAVFARTQWEDDHEKLLDQQRLSWTAGSDGRATVTVTPPRDGDYRLIASATDNEGNNITGNGGVWVMSGDYATFGYPYQDIDVRADKTLYREGDTAQIVVNTRYAPITALLTIEGPSLLEHRLVQLQGKSTVIPVKVSPEFMPSVKASVCFLKGKKFYSGEAAINVSREKKALRVEITADKGTYLPGEKAVYHVKTLTPEGKPVQAEVSLGLVDESIYSIAPESAENIVSFFYPKRSDEVQTVFSFPEIYLSGDDKAGSKIQTRRRFLDTAFWKPTVVTDAQGKADLTIGLPDNLTTWRATARAATLDTRVGETTAKVIVQKPFLVNLEPPRFLTQGDRVQIVAVAHNLSGQQQTADFGLDVNGLQLRGNSKRHERLDNGQTARLEWEADVTGLGQASIRAWGQAGKLDDAMELKLPILPRGRERVDLQQGTVASAANLRFNMNKAAIPGTPQMTVLLTPSLASAMLGSLDYLAQYPYGCVEQTMSAFLPDIFIKEMLGTLKIDNPRLDKELPKMVSSGLLKLYALQHDDGGWGWWTYDESDPWMTSYVIFGLAKARAVGYPVNEQALQNGISRLERFLRDNQVSQDKRGFAAYALATAGKMELAKAITNDYTGPQGPGRLAQMDQWGRLMLAQAMALTGQAEQGRAIVSANWRTFDLNLPEPSGRWWSEMDYGGALLSAAATLLPNDPRLPGLVRSLMEQRQGDHWYSTRDTAFILYGLSRYLLATKELQPDMTVKLLLNGKQVAQRRFTKADIFQPEVTLNFDAQALGLTNPQLTISKEGVGQLYYSASLTQSVALAPNERVENNTDLRVDRTYHKVRRDIAHGGMVINAGDGPSESAFRSGDIIEVTLAVRSQRSYQYLMLEDPLPAGCEVQDRGQVPIYEWSDWWCDQIVRDEKVGFALREIHPGVNRVTYYLIAQVPGTFAALPPRVFDMYRPQWRGEGIGQTVTIR